ncbi:MAG: DUF3135 domain-containing protein [Candidatus Accumulibacter sp.]|nr:DUF3135 domain-containing protein [Accumulibacter sp.]
MFDYPRNTQGSTRARRSGDARENLRESLRAGAGSLGPAGSLFSRRDALARMVQTRTEDGGFNFQEWAELAQRDPVAFEIRREQAISRFLGGASPKQRRRGTLLQREIDAARKQAGDPRKSLLILARMMCQELSFLGEGLLSLSYAMRRFVHPKVVGERRLLARSPRP